MAKMNLEKEEGENRFFKNQQMNIEKTMNE